MKASEFRAMIREKSLQDLWWLALDESVLDEQLTLEQIEELRRQKPKSTFSILNIAHTEEDRAQWLDLNDISAKVDEPQGDVAGQLAAIRQQLAGLEAFIKQIHQHFIAKENLELKEIELREREKFLEESEEALLQKIQMQEEQLAEIEQHREEMADEKSAELRAV